MGVAYFEERDKIASRCSEEELAWAIDKWLWVIIEVIPLRTKFKTMLHPLLYGP